MGKIVRQPPVKLICGFIFKETEALHKAEQILKKKFGPTDFTSEILSFKYTDYYEKEFGQDLKRSFISFNKLIPADSLAKTKISTNTIEEKLSHNRMRFVNIDPGYLDLAKLVLASTKDYTHRIYLSGGIFAEITLLYRDNTFQPWPWTYPDYRTKEYIEIFNAIRCIYEKQLKR